MPEGIPGGSVAERILSLLAIRYPATLEDVALALSLRPDAVRFEVRRLRTRGLVVTEEVGGKTYVVLSGAGFRLMGRPSGDAEKAMKALKLPPAKPRDETDPAFM